MCAVFLSTNGVMVGVCEVSNYKLRSSVTVRLYDGLSVTPAQHWHNQLRILSRAALRSHFSLSARHGGQTLGRGRLSSSVRGRQY